MVNSLHLEAEYKEEAEDSINLSKDNYKLREDNLLLNSMLTGALQKDYDLEKSIDHLRE
mgnify:CR=1 FL=1